MADHLKNFASGLALLALTLSAIAGMLYVWKAVLFAALTLVALLAIYMVGYSWRKQREARNVR